MTHLRWWVAFVAATICLVPACGDDDSSDSGAGDTVTIGLSAGFSGQVAFYGQNAKKGIDLAIEELNAAGGPRFELVTADDECSAQGGVSAYRQLISEERVDVVLGSTCSDAVLAGTPILATSKVPGLTFSTTNPKISQQSGVGGNEYSWRMNIDDSIMADTVAGLIARSGSRNVALLVPNSEFGRGAQSVYSEALPDHGVTLVTTEYFELNTGEMRAQLTKIGTTDADTIVVFGNPPDCVAMVRQMNEIGLELTIYSRAGCATQQALDALGDQTSLVEGAVEATYWMPTPEQEAFLNAFRAKYGEEPDYNAALGYMATQTLARAVQLGGTDSAGIQQGLREVEWDSPIGPITFDDHNQAHPSLFIGSVENGEVVFAEAVPTG